MADVKFLDIAHNPHFNQFVSVISVPFSSLWWKRHHPEVPFWTLWEGCTALLKDEYFGSNRQQFVSRFLGFLTILVQADSKLSYSEEDMQWLAEAIDGSYALTTMSMLFAYASAKREYLTPVQIAEATSTSESNWRNKAASGEFVGAFKAGKQWLLPVTALRAHGIEAEVLGQAIDEEREDVEE